MWLVTAACACVVFAYEPNTSRSLPAANLLCPTTIVNCVCGVDNIHFSGGLNLVLTAKHDDDTRPELEAFYKRLRQTLSLTVIAWSLYGIVCDRLGSNVQCRQHQHHQKRCHRCCCCCCEIESIPSYALTNPFHRLVSSIRFRACGFVASKRVLMAWRFVTCTQNMNPQYQDNTLHKYQYLFVARQFSPVFALISLSIKRVNPIFGLGSDSGGVPIIRTSRPRPP